MKEDIFNNLRKIQEDIKKIFSEPVNDIQYGVGKGSLGSGAKPIAYPDVDIIDRGEEIEVVLDMPGLMKEDIRINLEQDKLEVKGKKKFEREEKEENFYHIERGYSGFYRRIDLPEQIVPEKARAKYESGVLRVRMPKAKIDRSNIRVE